MEYGKKKELMFNNLLGSQNVQKFEGSNLKNDILKARNAEITNYGIMHIFN